MEEQYEDNVMAENVKKLNDLNEFLEVSKSFIGTSMKEIIQASGKNEDTNLIISHSDSLQEQFDKLITFVIRSYEDTDVVTKKNIDEFMKLQAVTSLAGNAKKTITKNAQKGIFGDGFFSWLESNLEEIKKIIEMILELIFPNLPPWVGKILQILDQILKLILGLVGGILGKNRSKIMEELSSMEVAFWNELAAYRRFSTYNYQTSEADD